MRQLYAFATTKRTVRSGGAAKELTHYELVRHKQLETAMAGNSVAQRDVLRQSELAILSREQFIESDCETWTRIKDRHQKILDDARAAKAPLPRVLPHPDDILIDWTNGVRILGPIDDEDYKRFDQTVRMRDALFVQQAMEDCLNGVRLRDRPTLGAAGLLGFFFNETLPPSLRMSESDWINRVERLSRLSKRDALKSCRAAWWALGVRIARGEQFGSAEKLKPMLTAMYDLAKACLNQSSNPLGYEDALEHCAFAMNEFRASAPKPKEIGERDSDDEESAA